MKIIESGQEVAEGWHSAVIVAVVRKDTRKGEIPFLRCRIASGKDKGREVDYRLPQYVREKTHCYRFLVSVLGSLDVGTEVDPEDVVGKAAAIRVARAGKGKRRYCNVVAISPTSSATASLPPAT